MGTVISKMYDEIKLHGSWEAYVEFRDIDLKKVDPLPDQADIPYFPDPEVVENTAERIATNYMLDGWPDWLNKETVHGWEMKMRFNRTKSEKNHF